MIFYLFAEIGITNGNKKRRKRVNIFHPQKKMEKKKKNRIKLLLAFISLYKKKKKIWKIV